MHRPAQEEIKCGEPTLGKAALNYKDAAKGKEAAVLMRERWRWGGGQKCWLAVKRDEIDGEGGRVEER